MRRDSRGQSDTVGVVLLTAVFVVLAVIVGAFLLSNFDDSDQTKPTVDIASDIDGQTVMIDHRGGNRYEAAEIRVVIREQDSDDRQYSLDEFTLMSGGDEGGFAPGDRWKKTIADLDGEFRLLVVDDSNGEIIHQEIHVAAWVYVQKPVSDGGLSILMMKIAIERSFMRLNTCMTTARRYSSRYLDARRQAHSENLSDRV